MELALSIETDIKFPVVFDDKIGEILGIFVESGEGEDSLDRKNTH